MNLSRNLSRGILCLGFALSMSSVYAEDIDIYSRPETTTTNSALNPNILIVIDNSSNWSAANQGWPDGYKQGESELKALVDVITTVNKNTNLGLMMFTPAGSGGGYVRYHVRPMTDTNKQGLVELIGDYGCVSGTTNSLNGTPNCILKNFQSSSEKVSAAQADYSAAMLEVFKYFGGYTWPAHSQDDKAASTVYPPPTYNINNADQFGTVPHFGHLEANADISAFTDSSKTFYNSPLNSANSCSKNYVIFIGNGFSSKDSPSTLLGPPSILPAQGVGGDVTQLPVANLAESTQIIPNVLLGAPACGTYQGATAADSLAACTAKTIDTAATNEIPDLYPGYTNYYCEEHESCLTGTVNISQEFFGKSSCGLYPTQAACETALAGAYPNHSSHSCSNETACTVSTALTGADTVVTAKSVCIPANNVAACEAQAPTYYPGYSSYSCSNRSGTDCPGGSNTFKITAGFKVDPGFEYSRSAFKSIEAQSNSFSQYIKGTKTNTAATPNGTFTAPTTERYFDEWARFLNQTDVSAAPGKQNITTFTIDVFKDAQDIKQSQLLISAAQAGGGKYFTASNELEIKNALKRIISEIQSVNSVFASSSLPVSVNTQGTYLNQVFMGMFRPEGGASPRWPGNLKQYKFKLFNGVLRLSDKNGDEAISATTGFVTPCADSFWTTDTGDYWNFGGSLALGGCTAQTSAFSALSSSAYSDGPDGEVVEKGGAAQQLRGVYSSAGTLTPSSTRYSVCGAGQTPSDTACRKLFTCDGSSAISCASFTNFDTANTAITASVLNLADTTKRDSLINWTRGQDVDNENANLTSPTDTPANSPITNEMRPSVHGGVVHSQPAVVDYGGTIGTIAFYGADDGVFHAVDGGQTDSEGIELWGFIAPETLGKLNRLRNNSPLIAFPSIGGLPDPTRKDYFFDGSIGVYQKSGTVWIYSSMRRGGRSIYAFDVSDPTAPVLKWRKGCFTSDTTDDTMCSSDTVTPNRWLGIGQTWSHPTIAYISGYVDISNNPKPVLVFGGGYDQCEDANSQTRCAGARKGANIWFVDANSGAIIRTYPTHYSVAGDLAIVTDSNNYLTHVYASDTGGNVYRINVGSSNTFGTILTSWTNNSAVTDTIIASVSETNQSRKFLNGPSIVPTAGYNAVLLGSGDREHPLVTDYACTNYSTTAGSYVTNQFYMLIDKPAVGYPSPTVTATALVDVTSGTTTYSTDSGTATITNVRGTTSVSSTKGWRFSFGPCEQTVNEALTIAGVTYFGTNAPSPSSGTSCTANLGIARGYAVDFLNGNPIPANASGNGTGIGAGSGYGSSTDPDVGAGAVGEVVNGVISGANGGTRSGIYVGGGMPPSPVAGVVDVDGTKTPFCIGCIDTSAGNASALQGSKVVINPPAVRSRSYWYMEGD